MVKALGINDDTGLAESFRGEVIMRLVLQHNS